MFAFSQLEKNLSLSSLSKSGFMAVKVAGEDELFIRLYVVLAVAMSRL